MTHVENTSYFEVAMPGHTISYKNVDNVLKMVSILIYVAYRNAQNVIDVSEGVLFL